MAIQNYKTLIRYMVRDIDQSIKSYITLYKTLLTDQCLDALALNETRLDDNISNEDIHIDSYDLIRFDRSRKGGGVCMYVKNSHSFLERNDLMRENLKASFIETHKPSSASFVVRTIYRPPSASVDSFATIEELEKQT